MRALLFAIVLVVGACGRVGFEARAAPDEDAQADAPGDAVLGAFAAPHAIAAFSDPGTDDDPTGTGDGLEIYFASERLGAAGGYADLFVSRRASLTAAWDAPAPVAELDSTDEDQSPGIAADGLTIYFASRRPSPLGGTSSNIWMATRPDRGAAWTTPVFVAELSTAMDEFEPQPDASGLRLVMYRQLSAADRTLFEATRPTVGAAWSTPVVIAGVDTPGDERSPCLARGGLELWFSSDRGGAPDAQHVFVATRPSLDAAFATPVRADTLDDDAGTDDDPWLSLDGRVLFMSSTRTGDSEIYEARR